MDGVDYEELLELERIGTAPRGLRRLVGRETFEVSEASRRAAGGDAATLCGVHGRTSPSSRARQARAPPSPRRLLLGRGDDPRAPSSESDRRRHGARPGRLGARLQIGLGRRQRRMA